MKSEGREEACGVGSASFEGSRSGRVRLETGWAVLGEQEISVVSPHVLLLSARRALVKDELRAVRVGVPEERRLEAPGLVREDLLLLIGRVRARLHEVVPKGRVDLVVDDVREGPG